MAPGLWTVLEHGPYITTSRELTPAEVAALKVEHGIIDNDLIRYLGLWQRRRKEEHTVRAVRALFTLGMSVEAIEDFFDLTTAEVHAMTRDVWEAAVRLLTLAGFSASEIRDRLELPLRAITAGARAARAAQSRGLHMQLAPEKIDNIRRRYREGVTLREIVRLEGVAMGSVIRYTKDLPGRRPTKGRPTGPRRATAAPSSTSEGSPNAS